MAQAPEVFQVKFSTTKGEFVVEATRAWAPHGVDRFHELVTANFYDEIRFFRVLSGFMAQFGIHGDPKVATKWRDARIPDDGVTQRNTRGMVTFATAGPNTRTTQLFINFGDNSSLDRQGFAPMAKVISGMEVVDKLHAAYGEGAPSGRGPDQGRIQREGNAYLSKDFAQMDYIKTARIVAGPGA